MKNYTTLRDDRALNYFYEQGGTANSRAHGAMGHFEDGADWAHKLMSADLEMRDSQIAMLVEALEFYARKESWHDSFDSENRVSVIDVLDTSRVDYAHNLNAKFGGKIARQALQRFRGDK